MLKVYKYSQKIYLHYNLALHNSLEALEYTHQFEKQANFINHNTEHSTCISQYEQGINGKNASPLFC